MAFHAFLKGLLGLFFDFFLCFLGFLSKSKDISTGVWGEGIAEMSHLFPLSSIEMERSFNSVLTATDYMMKAHPAPCRLMLFVCLFACLLVWFVVCLFVCLKTILLLLKSCAWTFLRSESMAKVSGKTARSLAQVAQVIF